MSKEATRRPLRCFLSSPFLVDTGPLRRVLQDLNVEVGSVEDLPSAGQMPAAEVMRQIQRASFVVGVLAAESSAVLFDLGVAIGLGKPAFVIADDKERLAFSLQSLPLVVASPADVETLRFHLESFVASLALRSKAPPAAKKPPRLHAGGETIPIRHRPSRSEADTEQRVEAAFRRAAANVTVSPHIAEESKADMIVWLPDLDIGMGGPLLVEVKSRATETFPESDLQQVQRLLNRAHLRAAVLVTNTPDRGVSGRIIGGAFVYGVSVSELERLAEADELSLELKRVRNRLAHGAM